MRKCDGTPCKAKQVTSCINTNFGNLGEYIRLVLSSVYTIGTKNAYLKLPLTTLGALHGDSFQFNSDGSVTVLRKCVVMVYGQSYFSTAYTNNDWVCSAIYINGSAVCRGGATIHYASPFLTVPTTYIGIRNAGDVIDMRVLNETGARGTIGNASTSTYLSVVALT